MISVIGRPHIGSHWPRRVRVNVMARGFLPVIERDIRFFVIFARWKWIDFTGCSPFDFAAGDPKQVT